MKIGSWFRFSPPFRSLPLSAGGSVPAILQEAAIPVVEHAVCSTPAWWGDFATKTMVCAGGDGRTAGCQVKENCDNNSNPLRPDHLLTIGK